MTPQTIILSATAGWQNAQLFCTQGETGHTFRFKVANGSEFVDLSVYSQIVLTIDFGGSLSTPIGHLVDQHTVEVSLTSESLSLSGNFPCWLVLINETSEIRLGGIGLQCNPCGINQFLESYPPPDGLLQQLIQKGEYAQEQGAAAETIVNRWQNIPAGDFDNFYVRAGLKAETVAGRWATAEGQNTTASADWTHAEGLETIAAGTGSHAEGADTEAIGNTSHAEGSNRTSSGSVNPPIIIDETIIPDLEAPLTVKGCMAYGRNSHAEGCQTLAYGSHSHAEGHQTVASGDYSHASGNKTYATGNASIAVGTTTRASGGGSFAEGLSTQATGMYSHAQGGFTVAKDYYAFATGAYTIANLLQLASGKYNKDTAAPTSASSTNGSLLVIGNGTKEDSRANAFRVATSGAVYGNGAYNSSGADYAEMFEWADGNTKNEDRRGLFVTLDGEKIRPANTGDYVLGVVSACPSVLGDSFFGDVWHNRYQRDIFGTLLTETVEVPEQTNDLGDIIPAHTEVHYIENPDYNPELQYTPRTERLEWTAVGMLGKLVVVDDGTCQINGFCSVGQNGVATASESGHRVIARLDNNHVKIIFR